VSFKFQIETPAKRHVRVNDLNKAYDYQYIHLQVAFGLKYLIHTSKVISELLFYTKWIIWSINLKCTHNY